MSTLDPVTTDVDLEKLSWLLGRTGPDKAFARTVVWEMIEDRLPRSPLARVRFHVGELQPNSWTPWHFHNGPNYHLVLQGTVALERAMDEPERPGSVAVYDYRETYEAGEGAAEPVGIPHRAGNPSNDTVLLVVTLHIVDYDRHHIVPMFGEPDGPVNAE